MLFRSWTLTQEQLQHILLPLGGMEKSETRKHAERYGLPTASKKDSQGICFLGKISMKEFLSHYIQEEQGSVLDTDGRVIGHHPGSLFFTLGERHGFTITKKNPDDQPLYVIAKDHVSNTLTVGSLGTDNEEDEGGPRVAILESINNMVGRIKAGLTCKAQIRYHGAIHELEFVSFDPGSGAGEARITPWDPTLTPGQSVVMYDGDMCLGGGIVSEITTS